MRAGHGGLGGGVPARPSLSRPIKVGEGKKGGIRGKKRGRGNCENASSLAVAPLPLHGKKLGGPGCATNCTLHCSMDLGTRRVASTNPRVMARGKQRREPRTAGTVEETVSGLDGVVDDVGSDVVADLPETEAHLGHLMAAVELDVGNRNHFEVVACTWATCLRESLLQEVLARLRRQRDGTAEQAALVPEEMGDLPVGGEEESGVRVMQFKSRTASRPREPEVFIQVASVGSYSPSEGGPGRTPSKTSRSLLSSPLLLLPCNRSALHLDKVPAEEQGQTVPPSLQRRWGPLVPVPRPAGFRHSIWIQRLHLKKVRRRFFRLSRLVPGCHGECLVWYWCAASVKTLSSGCLGDHPQRLAWLIPQVSHASTDSRVKAVGPAAETSMICAAQMGIRKVGFGGVT